MAEGILRSLGGDRFRAFSAGSHPNDAPHPLALQTLERLGFDTEGLHSKGWHDFGPGGTETMDIVITVCDNAEREPCPIWPGMPATTHWGVADPSKVTGTKRQQLRAFAEAAVVLRRRIELLVALPVEKLDALVLRLHLKDIGRE